MHVVLWAAFLVAFFGFLRKSNVVPQSAFTFDPRRHLSRNSFIFHKDTVVITLPWAKNNQFGERCLQIPLAAIPGSILCPVTAITNMFTRVRAPPSAPAFIFPKQNSWLTLTHTSFINLLRYFLNKAGFPSSHYTGHSFRKGGCVLAMTCKIPLPLIKFHGDWHSQAFERYLALPLVVRRRVTADMGQHLLTNDQNFQS